MSVSTAVCLHWARLCGIYGTVIGRKISGVQEADKPTDEGHVYMWVSTLEEVPCLLAGKKDTREAAVRKVAKGHGRDTIVLQPLWSQAYF